MAKDDIQRETDASNLSRRDLLQASAGTAAIAGTAVLARATEAAAQNAPPAPPANRPIRTGEQNPFYDYSPLPKRTKLKWPNGARVAVLIVPNVEHWDMHDDKGHIDVRNNPRNDYGLRVAIWRLFDIFGERRIPATIALNALVCRFYPEIIEAAKARGDEFMGHGMTNSEHLDLVPPVSAAEIVRQAVDTIRTATGERVRGWLGPGLGEGDGTLDALKAAGVEYVCDWGAADDQPFPLKNGMYAGALYRRHQRYRIDRSAGHAGFYFRAIHRGRVRHALPRRRRACARASHCAASVPDRGAAPRAAFGKGS